MASYTTVFSNGQVNNMVRQFVVDEKSGLNKINISQLSAGSEAFVIKDSQWYMLSNARAWEPIEKSSGGSSSGGGSIDDEVIYDGGNIDNPDENHIIYDGGSI